MRIYIESTAILDLQWKRSQTFLLFKMANTPHKGKTRHIAWLSSFLFKAQCIYQDEDDLAPDDKYCIRGKRNALWIQKLEKLLDSWRKRYLTLSGKVCIINSLALSKLYYCASILNFPNSENVKTINRLIFNFIWGSRDRIKRNTLIGKPVQGGIGVVDIESKFKSLKASWVTRLVEKNINSSWSKCFVSMLNATGFTLDYMLKTNLCDLKEYQEILQKMPSFYSEVICFFNECKYEQMCDNMSSDEFSSLPIWCNTMFKRKGKCLMFSNWVKSNILYVKDFFDENGMFREPLYFRNILIRKSNWICEYFTIKSIFKKFESSFDTSKGQYVNIKKIMLIYTRNKQLKVIGLLKSKDFYDMFIQKKFVKPYTENMWSKMFNIDFKRYGQHIYDTNVVKHLDKSIADFNYRLLHNLLNCNNQLSKWKRDVSPLCTLCNVVENCEHLILHCKNVVNVWTKASNILRFNVSWKHIVVGFYLENNRKTVTLNSLLSFIAMKIYKCKMKCRIDAKEESLQCIESFVKKHLMYQFYALQKLNVDLEYALYKCISDIL